MSLTLPFKLCGAGLKSKWPLEIALKPFHCCAVAQLDLPRRLLYKNNPLSTPRLIPHQIRHESTREPKLSLFQRFKQMYRDYWYVLVPVHLVTSAAWFGSFYYLASRWVSPLGLWLLRGSLLQWGWHPCLARKRQRQRENRKFDAKLQYGVCGYIVWLIQNRHTLTVHGDFGGHHNFD